MRYMRPSEADKQGFGYLFTLASNVTVMSRLLGENTTAVFSEYTDAVNSPFPRRHDGGMLHHVWVSGCKHGMSTINGKANHIEEVSKLVDEGMKRIGHNPAD